jgi:hypothetical protein
MDLELGEYAVEYIFPLGFKDVELYVVYVMYYPLGFKDVELYVVYVMYYYNVSTLQIWNSMGLL